MKEMSSPALFEKKITSLYQIDCVLGTGFSGLVLGAIKRGSTSKVAIKTLPRKLYELNKLEWPPKEVEILKQVKHVCIVSLKQVIETENNIFLVMECISGGDLFTIMQETDPFTEVLARSCCRDIVCAIFYLHSSGIAHRDIKAENCVLGNEGFVKLIDFGLAIQCTKGIPLTDFCGSKEQASPELLLQKPYNGFSVDMWAFGVLLFDIIVGDLPFSSPEESIEGDYQWPADIFSPELMNLIKKLFCIEERNRIEVNEVDDSEWMKWKASTKEIEEEIRYLGEVSSSSSLQALLLREFVRVSQTL